MTDEFRRVWAEIDLDAAENNIKEIRRITNSEAKIMAVVKADAYGHGATQLAKVFLKNGADRLAVAIIDEAEQLRLEGIDAPILILGCTHTSRIRDVVKYDIIQAVFTYEMGKLISNEAVKQKKVAKIHIKIDTGMGRIGFMPSEHAVETIISISQLPNLEIEGIFTHFATSDEKDKSFTLKQFNKFITIIEILKLKGLNIPIKHCANSAGIIDCPDMHLNMVRPGIILYGLYPSSEVDMKRINLKPLMSLKATIVHIKEVEEGTAISYGKTFITNRKSKIATIPIGYADGYSRAMSSRARVIVNEQYANVVGRVCMDQMMIDITDIPEVNVGDEVVLFGDTNKASVTAEEVADIIGTINYEVICMISKRIPRVYKQNKEIIKVINYLL